MKVNWEINWISYSLLFIIGQYMKKERSGFIEKKSTENLDFKESLLKDIKDGQNDGLREGNSESMK